MRISHSPFCKTDIKITHAQKELESKCRMAKKNRSNYQLSRLFPQKPFKAIRSVPLLMKPIFKKFPLDTAACNAPKKRAGSVKKNKSTTADWQTVSFRENGIMILRFTSPWLAVRVIIELSAPGGRTDSNNAN